MARQWFVARVRLPVRAEEAFAWHERPGALERLLPPWEAIRVVHADQGIDDGRRAELRGRVAGLPWRWVAEHHDCQAGREFRDVAVEGPFTQWEHVHRFEPVGPHQCVLEDRVEFALPGGALGRALGGRMVNRRLQRMFRYRHDTLQADLALHARFADRPRIAVAVTGSSGLVGSALRPLLSTGGHRVLRIVRRAAADEDEVAWDTQARAIDTARLEGVDAVVHLAGKNIAAGRWTAAEKAKIRASRVENTRDFCRTLAAMNRPPRVLVSASAVGYYGDRGQEEVDETASPGEGFLAEVCQGWEAATAPARERGIRVVLLRFGVIASPRGGLLARMLPAFRLGLGGRVGGGEPYESWISIDDCVGAIYHALLTDALEGPVNAVAPGAVTQAEFARILARVLRRPACLVMPKSVVRAVLGEMADALLLSGARAVPRKLIESGYTFRHPDLETALRHLLGRH